MRSAAMHCVGKYLRGSGMEDAFVETEILVLKIVQSVMEGSHYVRAFRGLLIAAEAVESMKWDFGMFIIARKTPVTRVHCVNFPCR